jgi:hypothetical protein
VLDCLLALTWGAALTALGFLAGVLWERRRHEPPPPDGNGAGERESVRRAAL